VSAPIELGENYQYRHTIYDATGVAADAGTVTVTVTLPDGTTATPTVTHSGTGLYDIDYLTAQTGRHTILGDATGGVLGTDHEKFDDAFHVELAGRMLISLDDAVTHLRATATITSIADRQQLRWYTLAASDACERSLGRVVCRRSITDAFDGGVWDLLLRDIPPRPPTGFVTPTSVVENGVSLVLNTDYFVAKQGWRLIRGQTNATRPWQPGTENITATYTAGCTDVPPVLRKVVASAVQRMWQTSQQQPHEALDGTLEVAAALSVLTPVESRAWDSFAAPGFG